MPTCCSSSSAAITSTAARSSPPFAEWREVLPNAPCVVSLVDRLVHNAEVLAIEGESYRLKEAQERAEQRARQRRKAKSRPKSRTGCRSPSLCTFRRIGRQSRLSPSSNSLMTCAIAGVQLLDQHREQYGPADSDHNDDTTDSQSL
jgi:hypothetical protein